MTSRRIAGFAALLLYFCCEYFQASPFAFLESQQRTEAVPIASATDVARADEANEDLQGLFTRGMLVSSPPSGQDR